MFYQSSSNINCTEWSAIQNFVGAKTSATLFISLETVKNSAKEATKAYVIDARITWVSKLRYPAVYYTGYKLRTFLPAARVFHISLVFWNARRVLSQCNTRLRLLYLLNIYPFLSCFQMFCDDVKPSEIFSCLRANKNDANMEDR